MCGQALKLSFLEKTVEGEPLLPTGLEEIRPPRVRWGLAEAPKQPSLRLRLCVTHSIPTRVLHE